MVNKWIQKTGIKRGALSRQLGIPERKNIPMPLLNKIVAAKPGQKVKYNKKSYKVTRLMERRAIMARNLKRLRRRK